MTVRDRMLGGLWGAVVGDALGVPVEFKSRTVVQADPVKDLRGFGTHHQPVGTWSDDSSLLLCTVESLLNLGGDTDTTGCVAGGLAGVLYGVDAVPSQWRNALARRDEIAQLFDRFADLLTDA